MHREPGVALGLVMRQLGWSSDWSIVRRLMGRPRRIRAVRNRLQARIEQLDAARSAVKTASGQRLQMSQVLELVQLSASYNAVTQRLTDATSAADKEAKARKIAAAIRVTTNDVKRLRELEQSYLRRRRT